MFLVLQFYLKPLHFIIGKRLNSTNVVNLHTNILSTLTKCTSLAEMNPTKLNHQTSPHSIKIFEVHLKIISQAGLQNTHLSVYGERGEVEEWRLAEGSGVEG